MSEGDSQTISYGKLGQIQNNRQFSKAAGNVTLLSSKHDEGLAASNATSSTAHFHVTLTYPLYF
jgi:hypothetical protein